MQLKRRTCTLIKDLMDFEGAIDSNFMVKSCEKGIAGSGNLI